MEVSEPKGKISSRNLFIGFAALAAAAYFFDIQDAFGMDAVPSPDSMPGPDFQSLQTLLDQIHSPYVTADSVSRLQQVVDGRIDDINALLRSLSEVAPKNANEIRNLETMRNELGILQDRLDMLSNRLHGMEASGMSAYRVNMAAAASAKELPVFFDTMQLRNTYATANSFYSNVTFGEVLVTDANGNLKEVRLRDLIAIGNTSDQISPVLGRRLLDIFENTHSGYAGWQMNSGAFELASAHGDGSDHIGPPGVVDCVDVVPTQKEFDAKRLGEFMLAAREDSSVRFAQIETGPDVTIAEAKGLIIEEWKGKISDEKLNYLLSKVVSNGSGVHIHIEFNTPDFYAKYPTGVTA